MIHLARLVVSPLALLGDLARTRGGKAAIFALVVVLHATLLLNFARSMRPPSTRGDNSSDRVAMTVAFVPASLLSDLRGQGEDEQTKTFAPDQTQSPLSDTATEAQGAGVEPAANPSGARTEINAQVGPASSVGGGGGTKDDPWSRASLAPVLETAGTFDLAARNDALFLSRVQRCLGDDPYAFAGVMIAVTLAPDGTVIAATPLRPEPQVIPGNKAAPTEMKVIAAIQACAPYHDLVLGRTPVLKLPRAGAPSISPSSTASLQGAPSRPTY